MSKLDAILDALAEEEGLSSEEREQLGSLLKSRAARAQAMTVREQPRNEIEFPAGPNAAAHNARNRQEAIERAQARGVSMYGRESPREAYERWVRQEQQDPEGIYGPGGGSAGGIFGDGVIAMPDYDPTAQARTDGRVSQQVQVRLAEVLERLLDRLPAREADPALLGSPRGRLKGR